MPADSVTALDDQPTVLSLSDVHGYRDRFESALLTLADHPAFDPVVERAGDADGAEEQGAESLRWVGGDEYVLVVNGDLVDRGPDSQGCLELLDRLRREAPDGHVRYLVGNHELYLPYPSPPEWDRWYSARVDDECRRRFWTRVAAGDVTAAFEGYEHTYVHAGSPDGVDPAALNDGFRAVAADLRERVGHDDRESFERVFGEQCPALFSFGGEAGPVREDPDAGVVWLDFSHLPADAPPQIVGHTPHEAVTRTGTVVCQDVIVSNASSPGGESLLVETPDDLRALVRQPDGDVSVRTA